MTVKAKSVEETPAPVQAIVVGGHKDLMANSMRPRLAELGVEVKRHFVDGCPNVPHELTSDLVIIVSDRINHVLGNKAKSYARRRHVPCVTTSKSWAKMEGDVRKALAKIKPEPAAEPTPEVVVRRAVPVGKSVPGPKQVHDAVVLVFEDRPELSVPEAGRKAADLLGVGGTIEADVVGPIRTEVFAEWRAALMLKGGGADTPRVARRHHAQEIRYRWFARRMQSEPMPKYGKLAKEAESMFGAPFGAGPHSRYRKRFFEEHPDLAPEKPAKPAKEETPDPAVEEKNAREETIAQANRAVNVAVQYIGERDADEYAAKNKAWNALKAAGIDPLTVAELADYFAGKAPTGDTTTVLQELAAKSRASEWQEVDLAFIPKGTTHIRFRLAEGKE